MLEALYTQTYATTTAPALLSEIDVSSFLGNVTDAVGDNFGVIGVIGAMVVAVTVGFWLLRKVISLFPGR